MARRKPPTPAPQNEPTATVLIPGTCHKCGCTETRACMEQLGQGMTTACSWTDDSQTLCTACEREEKTIERAAAGVFLIFEAMLAEGLIPEDAGARAKISSALVSAYICGASEENQIWQDSITYTLSPDQQTINDRPLPRDIGLDCLRESAAELMADRALAEAHQSIVIAQEADLRRVEREFGL